jgi:hypothetical protein
MGDVTSVTSKHTQLSLAFVSAKETTLIGRISDDVRIRACGSNFITLKE